MVGCSFRRGAWCPDLTDKSPAADLQYFSSMIVQKWAAREWRWHVGLWTLRYRTASGSLLDQSLGLNLMLPTHVPPECLLKSTYPREEGEGIGQPEVLCAPKRHQGNTPCFPQASHHLLNFPSLGGWSCLPGLLRWLLHKDNGLFQPMSLLGFQLRG